MFTLVVCFNNLSRPKMHTDTQNTFQGSPVWFLVFPSVKLPLKSLRRFLSDLAKSNFKFGGYWLVKLELDSQMWIKVSRPRLAKSKSK